MKITKTGVMPLYITVLVTLAFLSESVFTYYSMSRWPGYLLALSLTIHGLYYLYRNPSLFKPYIAETALLFFAATSFASSILTNTDPAQEARHVLYALSAFLVLPRIQNPEKLILHIIYAASIISITILGWSFFEWLYNYIQHDEILRIRVPYSDANPNSSSLLLMTPLLALSCLVARKTSNTTGVVLAVFFASILFITFQSRSFLLGMLICGTVLLGLSRSGGRAVFAGFIIFAVGLITLHFIGVLGSIIERGASHRPEIWMLSLESYRDCSILWGCGKETDIFPDTNWAHTHNIYLGTMVHTGAIPFISLLVFLFFFLKDSIKKTPLPLFLPSALMALGALLTESDYFITSFNACWLALWLSLALSWSEMVNRRKFLQESL